MTARDMWSMPIQRVAAIDAMVSILIGLFVSLLLVASGPHGHWSKRALSGGATPALGCEAQGATPYFTRFRLAM